MKKLMLIIMVVLFLMGCAGIKKSEYMNHDSHYKTWSHLGFSWYGYRSVSDKDLEKSNQQKWWGIPYGSNTYVKH